MLNSIKAAIFDMDGTIVDSMWVWDEIDKKYLSQHGYEIPPTLKDDISHLNFHDVAKYFKNTFNLPYESSEIEQHWMDMALDIYKTEVKNKLGIEEFLNVLKENNIKIGLATSNNVVLLEACLKANGIYDYFDTITLTSEVSRGKDCPDVYLLAAERLSVKPEECIVFEDILPAVKGAKKAGMKVVGVYDKSSTDSHEEIIKVADKFIADYTELIK